MGRNRPSFQHKIKFSLCPTEKHKGEMWEKLQNRDLDEPCEIVDINHEWSSQIPLKWWQEDTFNDYTWEDIRELMATFNKGVEVVYGTILTFDHPDGQFTTFRTYKVDVNEYYKELFYDNKKLRIVCPEPKKVAEVDEGFF